MEKQTPNEMREEGRKLINKADELAINDTLEGAVALALYKYTATENERESWGYDGGYGSNAWGGKTHKLYLEKAKKLLTNPSPTI